MPSSSAQPLKKQTISISITEDLRYFINNESIERIFLESKIQAHMKGDDTTIILRAAQTIPLEYVVEVMDVAYRNNFKIVLATQPN